MLPVCSATPICSAPSKSGGLGFFTSSSKGFLVRCSANTKPFLFIQDGTCWNMITFKLKATNSFCSLAESAEQPLSCDLTDKFSCLHSWNAAAPTAVTAHEGHPEAAGSFKYIESFRLFDAREELVDLSYQLSNKPNEAVREASETMVGVDMKSISSGIASEPLRTDMSSLASTTSSLDNFFVGMKSSVSFSLSNVENSLKTSLDRFTSSLSTMSKSASETLDTAVSGVFSTVDQTGEIASNKLSNLSGDFKEVSSKAAVIVLNLLRQTIVSVEDSLSTGTSYLGFSYNSAKGQLPQEIKDALNISEEKVTQTLKPLGTLFQQVYVAIEGLERSLGLNPNDPIIPFFLILGTSVTLWVTYWIWAYGGYAGNLSPKSTLELLYGKGNAVLIDIRPDILREKDGIPDLRQAARFRYASVTLPEADSSVSKLLKSGKDLEDSVIATVIRNLKIIQDRSKIIVMDADGSRSKGIARSLRKFGVKEAFLVQGGFKNWVMEGLRIKELKTETVLSILNEEAEAIFEDLKPSPVQLLGYGVAVVAAIYALTDTCSVVGFWDCNNVAKKIFILPEWERTLQIVGIIGVGQTIYRRLATYEDSEDFRKDISLLLAPVTLGAQAFSWAAGKLENNRIGLPTSPSSLDVQNRVLQAAAKHESQPSDTEGLQDPSPEPLGAQMTDNVDVI